MDSAVDYGMDYEVAAHPGMKKLTLSFVEPQNFSSPTYSQRVERFGLNFSVRPDTRKTVTDKRGNKVVTAVWNDPPDRLAVRYDLKAETRTRLPEVVTGAPFPPVNVPRGVAAYLESTKQVQADDTRIKALSAKLTGGAESQFGAVLAVMAWVVDNVRYVNPPKKYDALYSLDSGKGNCQNFSHLSAALLRAAGVPVRIVNGVTLDQPYSINAGSTVYTSKMGQGRHSWVEVWFPDLDWVPFDAQSSVMFVANRYVRCEVGLDNQETQNDGRMTWTQARTATGQPRLSESYIADFTKDSVRLAGRMLDHGPNNMLRLPPLRAAFREKTAPPPPPPPVIRETQKKKLVYKAPFVHGNLEFPENVNFADTRQVTSTGGDGYQSTRNFMVETAEYVTTKATQYAQVFELAKPLELRKIGLALHKFGGGGQLWVELRRDTGGQPGEVLAVSELRDLSTLSPAPGYRWEDFAFAKDAPRLMPGRYWLALGFTGDAILNWFFTYGKPVGPVDGTRYKGVFDQAWSGALNYEFNYRVAGMAGVLE